MAWALGLLHALQHHLQLRAVTRQRCRLAHARLHVKLIGVTGSGCTSSKCQIASSQTFRRIESAMILLLLYFCLALFQGPLCDHKGGLLYFIPASLLLLFLVCHSHLLLQINNAASSEISPCKIDQLSFSILSSTIKCLEV